MKSRATAFILVFLSLILVELADEVWLTQAAPKNLEVFPSWIATPDSDLFTLINRSLSSPLLDLPMVVITYLGSTVFWLIISLILWFRNRKKEAVLLAAAVILGGVIFIFLKTFIARPRPYQVISEARILELEGGSSFPSGHSKNAFTAAAILGRNEKRRWKAFLYTLASIVSYSRIYVGMHYPFDVLIGAIAGYLVAIFTHKFEKQIISRAERLGERFAL